MRDLDPGPITPPRYSPGAETTSKLVEVPKSTATQAPPTAVVRGDRVDEPVGAELVRVVDQDRHPGLQLGPDHQAGACRGGARRAARTRGRAAARPWRRSRRRGRSSSRSSSAAGRRATPPARRRWRWARCRSRQSRPSSVAVEGADVGLRVADVDREQHRGIIATAIGSAAWAGEALRDPRLAPVDGGAADARAQGDPLQAGRPDPGGLEGRPAGAAAFPGITVPALKLDGEKVQGSREIARELDRIQPEPPLFPADPEKRGKVEEAERWGDEFQQKPRRLSWWALRRDSRAAARATRRAPGSGSRSASRSRPAAPIVAARRAAQRGRPTSTCGPTWPRCPGDLDRIDAWIAEGVHRRRASRTPPTTRSRPSVRLLMTIDDLRPCDRGRPCRRAGEAGRPRLPRPARRRSSRPTGSSAPRAR